MGRNKPIEPGPEPPYQGTSVNYYQVQQWSEQALRGGLNHDFKTLGRKKVHVHYHAKGKECNERCETRTNPNLESE